MVYRAKLLKIMDDLAEPIGAMAEITKTLAETAEQIASYVKMFTIVSASIQALGAVAWGFH